jgi:hypothetical protein
MTIGNPRGLAEIADALSTGLLDIGVTENGMLREVGPHYEYRIPVVDVRPTPLSYPAMGTCGSCPGAGDPNCNPPSCYQKKRPGPMRYLEENDPPRAD